MTWRSNQAWIASTSAPSAVVYRSSAPEGTSAYATVMSRKPASAAGRAPLAIRVAAPVYLKFGLRNSPDVYPSGSHLENTVIALSRERVRRAEIAKEMIARFCPEAVMSPLRAKDLGIPAVA